MGTDGRESKLIVFTNDGEEWSVLDRYCGVALIAADDGDGQDAFEDHRGKAMVRAAEARGTCHRFEGDAEERLFNPKEVLNKLAAQRQATWETLPACPACGAKAYEYTEEFSGTFTWQVDANGWHSEERDGGDVGLNDWWIKCRACSRTWSRLEEDESGVGEGLRDALHAIS